MPHVPDWARRGVRDVGPWLAAKTSVSYNVPSIASATPRPHSGNAFTRVLYDVLEVVKERGKDTYLIAPAAMLGPNHCPTWVPSSFPARAMRCTLNGAWGSGVSRNQVMMRTYVA